jgi:hypothetical protein
MAAEKQTEKTTKGSEPVPVVAGTGNEGLTEGLIVHYVMDRGHNIGVHRPAIVVRDWKQQNGLVQLQVFTDGLNDGFVDHNGAPINVIWCTSVAHDEQEKAPGTWHWPERV